MRNQEIKFKGSDNNYSIIVGKNALNVLPSKIKILCPKTKKIALFIDKNIPSKFTKLFKKKLKNYDLIIFKFKSSEKLKSFKTANFYLESLLKKNLNRSDLIISVGGGIAGDVIGFVASIFKRGVPFINVPTTLLAQSDSAIGGKTGVNSFSGKNLIGTFYQPKIVIADTTFIQTLPKKEMICGFAEILKHSIIKDAKFFNWLKKNSNKILKKNFKELSYAIRKSCQTKIYFVNKDVNEKGLRMILNFGHTFAHAIEAKSNFSKKISHGEAVLSGMILATRLSIIKNTCKKNILESIEKIYEQNNLVYTYRKFSNPNNIISLIRYLKNDKKNEDDRINFILLKKIGKTTMPNKFKISIDKLKKYSKIISQI